MAMSDTSIWCTHGDRGPVRLGLSFSVQRGFPSSLSSLGTCFIRPGDTIKGVCSISTLLTLDGAWVEISLQGRESALLSSPNAPADQRQQDRFTAERVELPDAGWATGEPAFVAVVCANTRWQFLYVRHRLQLDNSYASDDGQRVYAVPFILVVPPGIDRTSEWAEDTCRPLPPTFRAQELVFDEWTSTPPPKASIDYDVRASAEHVLSNDGTSENPSSVVVIQPVTCLPYVEMQPPIETLFFPDEYVLSATQSVWKSIIGRKLGSITVTTTEPRPLVYDSEELSATGCSFRISIEGDLTDLHRFRAASIEVDPVLQTRSYFSATRLAGIPDQASVNKGGRIRFYMTSVRLEKRSFSSLQWKTSTDQLHIPEERGEGTEAREASRSGGGVGPFFRRGGDSTLKSAPQSLNGENSSVPWHTLVTMPIKPPLRLQPSFCGDYLASTYAIITKVSVSGVYAKSMYLVSPLQVAYPCSARPEAEQRGCGRWDGAPPRPRGDDDVCCSSVDAEAGIPNQALPPYLAR